MPINGIEIVRGYWMNDDNQSSEKDNYYYYRLGDEYLSKKEYQNAIKYLIISLKIQIHCKTYEKLYECYNGINQKDMARQFLTLAYNTNPKSDKVSFIYAKALIKENELDKAEGILLETLKRNPSYKQAKILYEKVTIYGSEQLHEKLDIV